MKSNRSPAFVVRWAVFAGTLLTMLVANNVCLDHLHRRAAADLVHWLLFSDAQQFRCAVLGSSAARSDVDIGLLEQGGSGRVLDLSQDGTAFPEQKLLLDLLLDRHQVATLVIAADPWGITDGGYSYPYHEYAYLPYIENATIYRNLAEAYGWRKAWCWRWIPMFGYSEFNNRIGFPSVGVRGLFSESVDRSSYRINQDHLSDAVMSNHGDPRLRAATRMPTVMNPIRQRYLQEIVRTATRRGVRVALFLAPVHRSWREAQSNYGECVEWYRRFAQEQGVPWFETRDPEFDADHRLFANASHLNREGARRFTKELSDFLRHNGL